MEGFDPAIIAQHEKDEVAGKIKNDLNDYFKFVALLEKKRSSKNTRLIEEYIKVESNIKPRIAFIEQIDREARFAERAEPQVDQEDIKKAGEKIKSKQKVKMSKTSLFTYLFSTKRLIKNFGDRTRILLSKYFGFSLNLTGDAEFHYKKILQEATLLLLKPVTYILEHGWRKLDRRTYNTVVVFSKFLIQFTQLGNILHNSDNQTILKKMDSYIEAYLLIVGTKGNKDNVKEAFYKTLMFVPSFKENLRDITSLLNDIVDTESRGMCFYNILTGTYMIKYRHFIKIEELLKHYNVQSIDDSRYHFSSKVLQHIKDMLVSLEHKHTQAEQELFFLKFVDEDLFNKISNENQIVQLFGKAYLLGQQKENKDKIAFKDKNPAGLEEKFLENHLSNLADFIIKVIEGFIIYYENVLMGRLQLIDPDKGIETRSYFKEWIFASDLTRLTEYINELNMLQTVGGTLTVAYEVYDKFNNTGKTEIEKEEKLCTAFKKVISEFYNLAEKLAVILYNHFVAQNLKGKEKLSSVQTQEIPIEDLQEEAKLLPFAIYTIEENKFLKGRLLIDVINEIMVFSINVCQLFKYHPLHVRYLSRQKYIDITEDYINLKSKIE